MCISANPSEIMYKHCRTYAYKILATNREQRGFDPLVHLAGSNCRCLKIWLFAGFFAESH